MSTLSTHDLRSAAKPYQREKTQTVKWTRPAEEPQGHHCHKHTNAEDNCRRCLGKPNRRPGKGETKLKQNVQNKISGRAATLARKAFRNEVVDAMDGPVALVSDTSEEEDVPDASDAPLPAGADFMYSYDRPGPRHGTDIFSSAITQAVRRFENHETEKLVSKEYNVVDDKEMADLSTDDDEHDFEIIEHSHLK